MYIYLVNDENKDLFYLISERTSTNFIVQIAAPLLCKKKKNN